MGVRDPETGKDRKGERERHRSGEKGRQGDGAEKARCGVGWVGGKRPRQRRSLKQGSAAQETSSGDTSKTDVRTGRGRESKAGDPDPGGWGARSPDREQRLGHKPRKGREGVRKSGTWGASGFPRRDPKGSEVPAYRGDTKRGKNLQKGGLRGGKTPGVWGTDGREDPQGMCGEYGRCSERKPPPHKMRGRSERESRRTGALREGDSEG